MSHKTYGRIFAIACDQYFLSRLLIGTSFNAYTDLVIERFDIVHDLMIVLIGDGVYSYQIF